MSKKNKKQPVEPQPQFTWIVFAELHFRNHSMYPVEGTFTDSIQASAYATEMNARLDSESMRKCGVHIRYVIGVWNNNPKTT